MTAISVALLVVYGAAVTWQMRRALRTSEPGARLREARRLLLMVSAGAPLVAVLILIAI